MCDKIVNRDDGDVYYGHTIRSKRNIFKLSNF